jgi:hypothetical protein
MIGLGWGGQRSFWLALLGSLVGSGVMALAVIVMLDNRAEPKAVPVSDNPPPAPFLQQTEVFFINGLKSQPSAADEWWPARSDHRLVAHGVLYCKEGVGIPIDTAPRQVFSALLLDLTPVGNHVFQVREGDEVALTSREKDIRPLVLTSADQSFLSLSDSIARARLAAFEGANSTVPWVQKLGLATLIISALATLFVTLQGKMTAVDLTADEKKTLQRAPVWQRARHVLIGPGSGFKWIAFLAIALSIAGTSLTGLKQVFDPSRTLNQNTRALLDLRQLHQEVVLALKCEKNTVAADHRASEWASAVRRIRATIIPGYGAYANLDVGGSSQRPDPTQQPPSLQPAPAASQPASPPQSP